MWFLYVVVDSSQGVGVSDSKIKVFAVIGVQLIVVLMSIKQGRDRQINLFTSKLKQFFGIVADFWFSQNKVLFLLMQTSL